MKRTAILPLFLVLALAGCSNSGGNSSSNSNPPGSQQPPPLGNGSLNAPVVVTVGGGGVVSGVDIAVAPASTPNAQVLGVAPLDSGSGSASNAGDQMRRGATEHVLLFGPGLNASMQVQLSGPLDYTISNKSSIVSTDSTPGIEFDLTLSPTAALGDRTVILVDSSNHVTTFTGGLEVLP